MTPEQAQAIARTAASQSSETFMVDAAHDVDWKAQEWIIHAIITANEIGRQNGQATAEAEHRLLSQAIEQRYAEREINVIRSTAAAVIEAVYDDMRDQPEKPFVLVNVDKQATIWDRWALTHELKGENTHVLMQLERKQ